MTIWPLLLEVFNNPRKKKRTLVFLREWTKAQKKSYIWFERVVIFGFLPMLSSVKEIIFGDAFSAGRGGNITLAWWVNGGFIKLDIMLEPIGSQP